MERRKPQWLPTLVCQSVQCLFVSGHKAERNTSAWLDAIEVMGEVIAFIALLVIDRNNFHPVTPILGPNLIKLPNPP